MSKKERRKDLVERLAHDAWTEFNHDNDPFTDLPGETHNSESWKRINDSISKTLKRFGI